MIILQRFFYFSAKEASDIFHNIMQASVKGNSKPAPKKKAAIKKVRTTVTISGVSLQKVRMEHQHQQALQTAITRHQAQLKDKGLKPAEKAHIRREIANYRYALSASKKHVTALKRTI